MSDVQQAQPKTKYKTFTYHTNVDWLEKRAGMLRSDEKMEFRVASPPEFKGEEGVWTPEDLFVAAVESCTMTTFLAFAYQKKLPVVSYKSKAEGKLEFVDEGYRFTNIIVKPEIIVESEEALEQAEKIIHQAHEKCLIANSVIAKVEIEPTVRVQ